MRCAGGISSTTLFSLRAARTALPVPPLPYFDKLNRSTTGQSVTYSSLPNWGKGFLPWLLHPGALLADSSPHSSWRHTVRVQGLTTTLRPRSCGRRQLHPRADPFYILKGPSGVKFQRRQIAQCGVHEVVRFTGIRRSNASTESSNGRRKSFNRGTRSSNIHMRACMK